MQYNEDVLNEQIQNQQIKLKEKKLFTNTQKVTKTEQKPNS